MQVDFPAPEGPANTRVSPAGMRKDTPSSAGPREGSQVSRTFSNATATPWAATVRTSRTGAGGGAGGRSISDSAAPVACSRSW